MNISATEDVWYDYVTIYLDVNSACYRPYRTLTNECKTWLEENMGQGAITEQHFLIGLPDQKYQWGMSTVSIRDNQLVQLILFRNEHQALMFKLAWGGK